MRRFFLFLIVFSFVFSLPLHHSALADGQRGSVERFTWLYSIVKICGTRPGGSLFLFTSYREVSYIGNSIRIEVSYKDLGTEVVVTYSSPETSFTVEDRFDSFLNQVGSELPNFKGRDLIVKNPEYIKAIHESRDPNVVALLHVMFPDRKF